MRAELCLELARVFLLAGKLDRALEALDRGLQLCPGHRDLARVLDRIDRRARPLLPSLGRAHRVNRWAARLRLAPRRYPGP